MGIENGFGKFFGYNRETGKNESAGRTVEGVTDDISTPEEKENLNARFNAILRGIGEVMDEMGIRAEEAMGQEHIFTDKLLEKKILTESDVSLAGLPETMRQAVKQVARERLDEKSRELENRKIA